jgi:stage II sporulation protein D
MTSLYKLAITSICATIIYILGGQFSLRATEIFFIKVLLNEFDTTKQTIFNISAEKEILLHPYNSSEKKYLLKNPKLQLLIKNNELYGRTQKGPFRRTKHNDIKITSTANAVTIDNTQYYGSLSLTFIPKEKKLLLLNTLELENYVYSVLSAESYQTWPNEMQKVQAIASRTYAVHQMLEKRKNKKSHPFDIKCTTFHQRYLGNHAFTHLRKAVDETKGLILTHKNNVALTMFDACCGGSVPAHIKGINFKKAPYLARKTPCHYCKNYALYKWRRIIPTQRFLSYLYKYKPIARLLSPERFLRKIKIKERDKAGVVHEIKIEQNKKLKISGKDLWMSMPNIIRSQNFSLEQRENSIIINGSGFGHQVGLCQRGARELIRRGWNAKDVLMFYYPGTTLSRLQKKINPPKPKRYAKRKEKRDAIIQGTPSRGSRHVYSCTTTDAKSHNIPKIAKIPASSGDGLSTRVTFSRYRHKKYGTTNILYDPCDANFLLNNCQTMGSFTFNYSSCLAPISCKASRNYT